MSDTSAPSFIDFDVLRGWEEQRDAKLQAPHRLPALARLVRLGDGGEPLGDHTIHGPKVLIGRYRAQHGPVDLYFPRLDDHEKYRLGAPHAHLEYDRGVWRLEAVNPRATTRVAGEPHEYLHEPKVIEDGTVITLGVVRFRFRTTDVSDDAWQQARDQLLGRVEEPALFLKRRGGVCGPYRRLDDQRQLVVGRTHPDPGVLPDTDDWPQRDENNWDLSGLFDYERKFVGFRHLVVGLNEGNWTVRAISSRQRGYVNRVAISSNSTTIESGDELALGAVTVRFHHPHRTLDSSRSRHIPQVIDWRDGHAPSAPADREDN